MKRKELILDRYQPVQRVGSGGFGTVVKAWDTRIQRWVAIKTIQLSEGDAARAARASSPGLSSGESETFAGDGARQAASALVAPSADLAAGENAQNSVAFDGSSDPYAFTPPWEQFPQDPSFLDAVDARHAGRAEMTAVESVSFDSVSTLEQQPVRELANVPGLDEARTAAMLQDANIVQVYDFEVRDSTAYLIMEYVDGISLSKLLRDYDDKLTLNQIAAVFLGVSHALSVAHANGVLHLDIKPDNVLIDVKGRVKVTDFGLATLADAHGTGFAGGGTIGYMPPEQIDQQPLDERCDEWALASVMYEMLSGENPFRVRQLTKAKAAIEESELVLPSLCWDDLDAQADDTLFMALDPDKDERFESVDEFVDEFLPLLGDADCGCGELMQLVNFQDFEDEAAEEEEQDPVPRKRMRDRIARSAEGLRRVGGFGMRNHGASGALAHAFGCLGSLVVSYFALVNMQALVGSDGLLVQGSLFTPMVVTEQSVFWVLLLISTGAGAIRPAWGALFSFELLGVSYVLNGQPAAGLLFMFVTALWWCSLGRLQHATGNVSFLPVVAGAIRLGCVTPLMAGYYLPPVRAVASTAYALAVAVMLAACTGGSLFGWSLFAEAQFGDAPIAFANMFLHAPFWCMAAGWMGSAAIVSLLCRRPGDVLSVLGAALASSVLVAALVLATWFGTGGATVVPAIRDMLFTALPIALLFVMLFVAKTPGASE